MTFLALRRAAFGSGTVHNPAQSGNKPRAVACSASTSTGNWQTKRLLWLSAALSLALLATFGLGRRWLLGAGLGAALVSVPDKAFAAPQIDIATRQGEVRHSEEEWRKLLTPEQYAVLRQEATERRYTSPLLKVKEPGTFVCGGCEAELFNTSMKYESGTGWPSFFDTLPEAVTLVPDYSIPFMPRTEVRCKRCQGHLGHVFEDGPRPTGLRYCMNGAAMNFAPANAAGQGA